MTVDVDSRDRFLIAALQTRARAEKLRADEGQDGQRPHTRIFARPLPLLVWQRVGDSAMWVTAEARAARVVAPDRTQVLVALPGSGPGAARWMPRGCVRLFDRKT